VLIDDPATCALFLDLDGTLIDIASAPDLVLIPQDLVTLLSQVSAGLNGAMAIVTGRCITEIDRFLNPLRPAAAGVHGAEVRPAADGEVLLTVGPIDAGVAAAVQRLSDLAPGIIIESKLYSMAVHYRLAAAAEPLIEAALRSILADCPDHFILSPGRCVIEVVPKQVSKGAALEASWLCLPSRAAGRS
jgi:trehalose 6-phosphate phosphatase